MFAWLLRSRVKNEDDARKGRWLSGIFLTIILILVGLLINSIVLSYYQFLGFDSILLILLFILYIVNRLGQVKTAASIFILFIFATIIDEMFFIPAPLGISLLYPSMFILLLLITGVFVSWKPVPLEVIIFTLISSYYYYYSDNIAIKTGRLTDSTLLDGILPVLPVLFILVGLLSWLSNSFVNKTLEDLQGRNLELQKANRYLAEQNLKKHKLGENITTLSILLTKMGSQQVSGANDQVDSITQVVNVVEELHHTASQIARSVDEVNQMAETALLNVQHGQEMVKRSREAVQRNRESVQAVINQMIELDHLTRRISEFVSDIRDLSDETHLLALNATIEAAGAGVKGHRFAVIASQVQKLSGRSHQIVDQIKELITELQYAGESALGTTRNTSIVADELERLTGEVLDSQDQVVTSVRQTNTLTNIISTATSQQTMATANVTSNIERIAEVADVTSKNTNALKQVIIELTQAAEFLNESFSKDEQITEIVTNEQKTNNLISSDKEIFVVATNEMLNQPS